MGDLSKVAQDYAYVSVKANVQASKADTEFNIQGKVYLQDHVAYINRIDGGVEREILPGDMVYDTETEIKYQVLGTELWQSTKNAITDSHHIKVIMRAISGVPQSEPVAVKTVTSKGRISA